MPIEFEPYHIHTSYSNCLTSPDSTMSIEDYAKVYKERGHHVLCISEHGNRSNVWQQFELANKYSNDSFKMTPLAAAEAYFVADRSTKEHRGYHLILVAKNMDGYYQLNEILSEANLSGFYYHARLDYELLRRLDYKNFICTSACFRKGSLVKTLSGYKQIESITTNDYILNMHNKWEKVNFSTHRQYNGRGCKIYIRSEDNPIICTDTHKFLTSSISIYNYSKKKDIYPLRWVEAKDLHVDCADGIKNYLLEPINEILYTKNNVINKSEWKNKIVKRNYFVKNNLKEIITITPEIMRLFGLWIGDGHISFNEEKRYYRVGISFNEKEFDTYWNDFIALASEQIGIVWSKKIDITTKKIELTSNNIEFFEFMYFLFGNNKAKSKHIPKRLVNINKDFDFNLLFGILLSDGYFRTQEKDGYKYGQCTLTSISSSLIQQFKYILEQYNIKTRKPQITNEHIDKNNIHHQTSYYFTISNNAFINISKLNVHSNEQIIEIFEKAIKHNKHTLINVDGIFYKKKYIEKIEYFDMNEEVYCLNVDSHSFVCENVIVHNCVAGPAEEEMMVQLHNIFRENFYLEVQHHPQQVQKDRNKWMIELSKKYKWPLIYGTDSHYVYKEEKELRRELLLASKITYGDEDEFLLYLPTAEEAYQMLKEQDVLNRAQIEEAMENTLILREFEGVHFTNEKKIPNPYPDMSLDRRNYLYKKTVCDEYIRKAGMPTKEEAAEIHAEMDTMTSTGTADYPLIMKKVVDKGIEYGGVITRTGRGSGASFVSNYAMGFSSINRLHCPVKMYPERFISADRLANGLPDLDLNMANVEAFEKAGKEILGEYGCLPMIAYGTAKTLSAFKLLARARDLDFDTANAVAKQIQNYEMDVKRAKENNADDPDYDVNDDIQIESYVEDKYLNLIEESKKYKGIITSLAPHPCAHLLSDKDLRREIGVIRVKSKSGSKAEVYAAFIDGKTADSYNYLKADFLRVDVVKTIYSAFTLAGLPVMTVDELLEAVKNDKEVWDLYAKGFTIGLNQVEREKSSQRCMTYKPKNVAELAAFIAGIRPK